MFLGRTWGLVFPVIGLLAMLGIFTGARRRRDAWPFAMTVLFFLGVFRDARGDVLALHDSLFHHRRQTPPRRRVAFVPVLGRGLFVLPVIAIYTVSRLLAFSRQTLAALRCGEPACQQTREDELHCEVRISQRLTSFDRRFHGGRRHLARLLTRPESKWVWRRAQRVLSLFAPPGATITEANPDYKGAAAPTPALPSSPAAATGRATTKR